MNKNLEPESNSQQKPKSRSGILVHLQKVIIVAILAFTTLAIVGIIYEEPVVITFSLGGLTFSILVGTRDS